MKNLFSKDNFLSSTFDKNQRKQSIFVCIALAIAFLASSFTFMNMFYCFADAVGSIVSASPDVAIVDTLRSVPIYLSFFMSLWTLLLVHAFYRNESAERLHRSLLKNGIALIAFAVINIIYVILGLVIGKYQSIVEGSPSPWFPLDSVLYSILFVAIGVIAILFATKWKNKLSSYVVPSRGPIVKKGRFGYCLLISLWMLFALFCFCDFWMGLFIIDFLHGYLAYSIAFLCVLFVNACFFIAWEFFYNDVKAEKRKEVLLPLALIGLVISIAAAVFYFVALGFNLDGPSNVGFGVLPVAFAANVNIATLIVVALPIIVSVVALVKGLILRKRG